MLPAVLKNLAGSEKAVFCVALLVAASVLTITGHMTVAEWQEYSMWITGIYVGGKAIEGAAAKIAAGKPEHGALVADPKPEKKK